MDEHQKDGVAKSGIAREPMTVAEFSVRLGKPLNMVIMVLLKQGVVAAKNQRSPSL